MEVIRPNCHIISIILSNLCMAVVFKRSFHCSCTKHLYKKAFENHSVEEVMVKIYTVHLNPVLTSISYFDWVCAVKLKQDLSDKERMQSFSTNTDFIFVFGKSCTFHKCWFRLNSKTFNLTRNRWTLMNTNPRQEVDFTTDSSDQCRGVSNRKCWSVALPSLRTFLILDRTV